MSSKYSSHRRATLALVFTGLVTPLLYPAPAEAIPAFARKHDLSCAACHTKPPRLNDFGEAFHMAGFQIPALRDGERYRKRQIGKIWSETDLLDIFALRVTGSLADAVSGADTPDELDIGVPRGAELYLAGALTDDVSYFLTFKGDEDRFGIGHEFFVIANLEPLWRRSGDPHGDHGRPPGSMIKGPMIMGPMLMVGKIDPSTNFSYSTNRQLLARLPDKTGEDGPGRFSLAPYAFAAKFFGITTGDGRDVEVTQPVLYNTDGDAGIDLHMMVGRYLFQVGMMQGLDAGSRDATRKKDPYLMARMNFGGERYLSGSVSGLVQWGLETARVDDAPIDWLRTGVAANFRYRHFDLYGAVIRDRIRDLPDGIAPFDDTAWGLTVQTDWLATDAWLLSLRYDRMDAGGFVADKADGRVVSLQGRYYLRDNLSFHLRDSYNAGRADGNPLRNFRHLLSAGIELVF